MRKTLLYSAFGIFIALGAANGDEKIYNACNARWSVNGNSDASFYKYTNFNPDEPSNFLNEADFKNPQGWSKPQTWWHWINGNVSREGIDADLREMADKGYGFVRIFHIPGSVKGQLKFNSPEWFDTFSYVAERANHYGLGLGIHNCEGWSEAGGPWITPELSMKYLKWTLTKTSGGGKKTLVLPKGTANPQYYYEDVAVVAWRDKTKPNKMRSAKYKLSPAESYVTVMGKMENAVDGLNETVVRFRHDRERKDQICGLTLEFDEPQEFCAVNAEVIYRYEAQRGIFLEASNDGKNFEAVHEFKFDMPESYAKFAPRKAKFWRIIRRMSKDPSERVRRGVEEEWSLDLRDFDLIADGEVSSKGGILDLASKTGALDNRGNLRQTPENSIPENAILKKSDIIVFKERPDSEGKITLDLPKGDWVVMRAGMISTGKTNHPATEHGRGLEVDKFDPDAVEFHFNSYPKKMIDASGKFAGKTFKIIETDSWEAGSQNWTRRFPEFFKGINGYDVLPWLPVYAGKCIGSVTDTENFLRDLRETFASLVDKNFYGKMRELTNKEGLLYESEGGSGVWMRDHISSFREADFPMTEVWHEPRVKGVVNPVRGSSSRKSSVTSVASFYGKKYVTCEALTSRKGNWSETPWIMKGALDTLFFAGTNVAVFHSYTHQPDETRPGWQMEPWGISQNRKTVWWPISHDWFKYVARLQYMLQQGKLDNRILILANDSVPWTGDCPGFPNGFQADTVDGDSVRNYLKVRDGKLVSPGRQEYEVLIVSTPVLKLETLEAIKGYAEQGAIIAFLEKPITNTTLRGGEKDRERMEKIVSELFPEGPKGHKRIGEGIVYYGHSAAEVLNSRGFKRYFDCNIGGGAKDDIFAMARRSADGAKWFWILNSDPYDTKSGTMSFDVSGKDAYIWNAETGRIERAWAMTEKDGRTVMPLSLKKMENIFVVFKGRKDSSEVVEAKLDGEEIFPSAPPSAGFDNTKIEANFTMLATVSPKADRKTSEEKASGILTQSNENFLLHPEQMHLKMNDNSAACAGISAGKNSVAVFEHGAGYFNSPLSVDTQILPNTRIAVVYKNSVPSLYINGKFVKTAPKASGRKLHPADSVRKSFRGSYEGFEVVDRALTPEEIAADFADSQKAKDTKAAYNPPPPSINRSKEGLLSAEFFKKGLLELKKANGKTVVLKSDSPRGEIEIKPPFEVSFDPKWGGPEKPVMFGSLSSWTDSSDEGIKHYSGLAVYKKTFALPRLEKGEKAYLLIDDVREVAKVRLNGKDAGTMWRPPFNLEITDYLKEGDNLLEITVGNTWVNRCLYDATLPKEKRLTWANSMKKHFPAESEKESNWKYWAWTDGPLESGLIGKMSLIFSKTVSE